MNYRKILFVVFLLLFVSSSPSLFAQDTTKTTEEEEWNWDVADIKGWVNFGKSMPSISLNYGFTDVDHKNITQQFANAGLFELKLGHTTRRVSHYGKNVIKYKYHYFYVSNISTSLAGGVDNPNELDTKTWRFGLSKSAGYGYKLGNAAVILYNTDSFDWTRVDFKNAADSPADQNTIDRFDESFRFGTSSEGGIRVVVTKLITLEAGYERSVIFERHLFWKWAGSFLIEKISQGLLDAFVKEIFKSSPSAGPVVNFVLKNALTYGIYELRQEKMNWPFSSAAPLSFDSFKFGVTFTF